jgi:hypothetical protein
MLAVLWDTRLSVFVCLLKMQKESGEPTSSINEM